VKTLMPELERGEEEMSELMTRTGGQCEAIVDYKESLGRQADCVAHTLNKIAGRMGRKAA